MTAPTNDARSPVWLAGQTGLDSPKSCGASVGATPALQDTRHTPQARSAGFSFEIETPEELAARAAESREIAARNRRYREQENARLTRLHAEEQRWMEERKSKAEAARRREAERAAVKDAILDAKHKAALADAELKAALLAKHTKPAADAEAPEAVESALATRLFDPGNPPAPPVPILSLGSAVVCTPGNVSNIQAPAKAGKSAVVGAILAAVMNGNRQGPDCLGFFAQNPEGRAVIHLDTEQSRFDHHNLVTRAMHRAKVDPAPPWLVSASLADMSIPARRLALDFLVSKAAASFGGILAVLIDGVADLCMDPNDAAEAFALVGDLHALAIRHDCAVLTVLHENPNSETGKTRGHLGSQLERKAESNLRLCKDSKGITTVWAEKARHGHIPKDAGTCFEWSAAAGMHVSCGTAREIQAQAKRDKHSEELATVFLQADVMTFTELRGRIADALAVGEATAARRIRTWLTEGLIRKGTDDRYRPT